MTDFKTADELGIQQWEHEQLLNILPFLETVPHSPHAEVSGFNLDYSAKEFDCGTVACIGGWCKLNQLGYEFGTVISPDNMMDAHDYVYAARGELKELFFPFTDDDNTDIDYAKVTPLDARQAVMNYLTTGKANWSSIVSEETHGWKADEEE